MQGAALATRGADKGRSIESPASSRFNGETCLDYKLFGVQLHIQEVLNKVYLSVGPSIVTIALFEYQGKASSCDTSQAYG